MCDNSVKKKCQTIGILVIYILIKYNLATVWNR